MKILLLSAYDAMSHRYWREGLVAQFPQFQWTTLTLPARFYSFRVLGNPLSFTNQYQQQLSEKYDLLIATSMVDITTLRGIFTSMANTPLWLYCHENQFAYPESSLQKQQANEQQLHTRVQAQMTFLYSCLAADKISFNSQWNLNSSRQGLKQLLNKLPERNESEMVQKIYSKASVLPVPLFDGPTNAMPSHREAGLEKTRLKIVWNHRWEYDKGPSYLGAFVIECIKQDIPCDFYINGQQFRSQPEAFKEIKENLIASKNACLVSFGFIESRDEYIRTLERCDVVVSTSLHDFQGLSVLEAVQHGCIPLLPNNLVYPEIFSSNYLYEFDSNEEQNAINMLDCLEGWKATGFPDSPDLSRFTWEILRKPYRQVIGSFKATI